MKKFKLLFGAIALAAVTLVSCSKNDDNNSNDNAIIGKWVFVKEQTLDANNEVIKEYLAENDTQCDTSYSEFKNNGDLVSVYYQYSNNNCNQFSETGKWLLTDSILVVTHKKSEGEGEDIEEYTSKIEGGLMTLESPLSREEAHYYDLNVVKLRTIYKKI